MAEETEYTTTAAAATAPIAARAISSNQNRPVASTGLSHSLDKHNGTMAMGEINYNSRRFLVYLGGNMDRVEGRHKDCQK